MNNRQRAREEGTKAEKKAWSHQYTVWHDVLLDSAAKWREILRCPFEMTDLATRKEFDVLLAAACKAFLDTEEEITEDTLRMLLTISWQTKAEFGQVPPVVAILLNELQCRGFFLELIALPPWFTDMADRQDAKRWFDK